MKNVLVTGGAGFIGSHLTEALLARGDRVRVIDDESTGSAMNLAAVRDHPQLTYVRDSLSSTDVVQQAVEDVEEVYHLAAAVGVALVAHEPLRTIETNVLPTQLLLAELRRRRVQVVALAGLLGGRLDHEWANLLECGSAARSFAGLLAPTDRGTVVITRHGCRMVTVRGRTCSLFALEAGATVTLRGTRWELERRRLRPGSHGLSNVSGTELDLTVHQGVVALVFVPPPKRRRR